MPYGVDTVSVQDDLKPVLKLRLILPSTGCNFEFFIDLFLLENTKRKLTLKFVISVLMYGKC